MFFTLGLKKLPFQQDSRQIIYTEGKYDEAVNRYILENYDAICGFFADGGYEFLYFPKLSDEFDDAVIKYFAPYLKSEVGKLDLKNDFILDYMVHPENREKVPPSLLYYHPNCLASDYQEAKCQFRGFALDADSEYDKTNDLSEAFWAIKNDLNRKLDSCRLDGALFDEDLDVPEIIADAKFEWESQVLLDEYRELVEKLTKRGVSKWVLEKIIHEDEKLSRLKITKDYRLFLPDYDNMEIKMGPLPKAIFLLFLKHPEGIVFKDLPDYREELLGIYKKVKSDLFSVQSENSIENVTNPNENHINYNCSRIAEAFLSRFDKRLAEYYYIDGRRTEAKKISLPREFVEWESEI